MLRRGGRASSPPPDVPPRSSDRSLSACSRFFASIEQMGTQRILIDPRWMSSSRNALVAWDLSRALRWGFKGKNDRRALGWMFSGCGFFRATAVNVFGSVHPHEIEPPRGEPVGLVLSAQGAALGQAPRHAPAL